MSELDWVLYVAYGDLFGSLVVPSARVLGGSCYGDGFCGVVHSGLHEASGRGCEVG